MFTEDWFRAEKYAEIRKKSDMTIFVEEKDLAAERDYNKKHSGFPREVTGLDDFKVFEISFVSSVNSKLSDDEKHFLCFIDENRVTRGQEVLDCLMQSHSEVKKCFGMGMAWCANDLTAIETLIDSLPQILDALVEKGFLSYINPKTKNTKELAQEKDELIGLAGLGI